ncbi:methylmalonyl-CoA mutase subunit beta [Methylocapsa sp. S129]|uniref:methylmalonyl-CoA mutase subunit beta n=1 Tax=Methylocapsa sp. S129 TaxID=1641869 RepID=UPI00131B18B6|nr:methylmalonyl-CoA mutase subunit beta [Methylocapsa sp. S129]
MTGLAGTFAPTDEQQWRKLVAGALKGGAFEKLVSHSDDGFDIQPIYSRRDGPRVPRTGGSWRVLARVDHPDAAVANVQALDDLTNGADGLEIIFAGAGGAYGYGVARIDAAGLEALFEGVRFDAGLTLELDLGPAAEDQALAVAALVEASGADRTALDLSFGLDPLGALARCGRAREEWREMARRLSQFATALKGRGFAGPFVVADARCVHAAGGSQAQELAFALSAGVDYLRALSDNGFEPEAARAGIAFRLAADADEFMSLAKFRALRWLWARVEEACDLPPRPTRIHGETAWRMMSARDPWVNVLRGAMAVFCAGLGGADSVSVAPFTQAIGLPDSFARRLARNSQLVLLEESHLGFVADPAAGAGAFEALTQALSEKAWSLFQTFEAQGGVYAALQRGDFQDEVAKVAEARARDVARRKTPLTGVSDFPDLAEVKVETLAAARPRFAYEGEKRAAPLEPHRLAEPFEALRDASDAALARDGRRPAIFLANLGSTAAFGARAAFAKSLFEAGGVEALGNDGFASASEAAAAFRASGARLACLCSSDEAYAAMAEDAARALKSAGAQDIFLAGKPGEREAALRAAGVDGFVFAGCDALAALRAAYQAIASTA